MFHENTLEDLVSVWGHCRFGVEWVKDKNSVYCEIIFASRKECLMLYMASVNKNCQCVIYLAQLSCTCIMTERISIYDNNLCSAALGKTSKAGFISKVVIDTKYDHKKFFLMWMLWILYRFGRRLCVVADMPISHWGTWRPFRKGFEVEKINFINLIFTVMFIMMVCLNQNLYMAWWIQKFGSDSV